MKTNPLLILIMIVFTIGMVSCRKTEKSDLQPTAKKPMNEITSNPEFNWETTKTLDVSLTAQQTGVVYVKPVEGDYYFYKGMLFPGSAFTTQITIPSYHQEVKLVFRGSVHQVTLNGNRLEYHFK